MTAAKRLERLGGSGPGIDSSSLWGEASCVQEASRPRLVKTTRYGSAGEEGCGDLKKEGRREVQVGKKAEYYQKDPLEGLSAGSWTVSGRGP